VSLPKTLIASLSQFRPVCSPLSQVTRKSKWCI